MGPALRQRSVISRSRGKEKAILRYSCSASVVETGTGSTATQSRGHPSVASFPRGDPRGLSIESALCRSKIQRRFQRLVWEDESRLAYRDIAILFLWCFCVATMIHEGHRLFRRPSRALHPRPLSGATVTTLSRMNR